MAATDVTVSQMRGRLIAGELLALTADGGPSWTWQLRDRLGQWMDMNSSVRWLDRGSTQHGHVVGSPEKGVVTVQIAGVNKRVNLPTARLTAEGLPSGAKNVPAPGKPTVPSLPKDFSSLSDKELQDLYWATRDHPDVPTTKFLRVAWEVQKRKIKIDPHTYPTAGMFAAGTPSSEEIASALTAAVVRTPAGAKKYGQPIGSTIVKDVLPGGNRRLPKLLKVHGVAGQRQRKASSAPSTSAGSIRAYPDNERLPDGRVILNDKQMSGFAPEHGPHSMMAHVEEVTLPDGRKVYALSKEREAVHDRLVQRTLDGIKPTGRKRYLFLGGGTASGKSTVTKNMPGFPKTRELKDTDKPPGEAVLLDPDAIKTALPEWDSLPEKSAAAFTHEESSMLTKQIDAAAKARGLDIVADGTGDNSAKKQIGKIEEALAAGYDVEGVYITVPSSEAVVRSAARGIETGRNVPFPTLMKIHRDVSSTVTGGAGDKYGTNFQLFDTDLPGKGALPIPIVKNGKIVDQKRWNAFVAKSDVPDLKALQDARQRALARAYEPIKDNKGKSWSPDEVKAGVLRLIDAAIGELATTSP